MRHLVCFLKLSLLFSVAGLGACAVEDKEYDGEGMSPLEVTAYLSSTRNDEGYSTDNTIFYDVRARHANRVLSLVLPSSEVTARVEAGETYQQIAQEGVPFDEQQLAACNTLDGLDGLASTGKEPETSYTVVVCAEYADGGVESQARTVMTRVKPPETFIALQGMWSASLQVRRGEDGESETITFPVEITQGVDDATEAAYLSKYRVACLGFGKIDYYSPADLRSNKDNRFGNYWNGGSGDASNDYGPKWFLEIVHDEEGEEPEGGSTDTEPEQIIVPAPDNAPPLFRYETNLASNYLAGCDGETAVFSEPFQVEVDADRNRIVVRAFEAEGSIYYPSVVIKESNSASVVLLGVSDLILTRTEGK